MPKATEVINQCRIYLSFNEYCKQIVLYECMAPIATGSMYELARFRNCYVTEQFTRMV